MILIVLYQLERKTSMVASVPGYAVANGAGLIALNRPQQFNTFNTALADELCKAPWNWNGRVGRLSEQAKAPVERKIAGHPNFA
jgi:hypothetical protein